MIDRLDRVAPHAHARRRARGAWVLCVAVSALLGLPGCGGGAAGSPAATAPVTYEVPASPPGPAPTSPDGVVYEPIPADPDIYYDGPPPDDAWDTHWGSWDDIYEDWDPADSDWANTQSDWQEADLDELSEQPEPDLNCDICEFPRAGLLCIMQNDGHGDARRTAELRGLAKSFIRRTVLESRGTIHEYWKRGILAGVEFDWFFPEHGAPTADDMLETVGQVYGVDEAGLPVHLANVYCYDADQFAARVRAVEEMIGHTMERYTVWEDNTVTSLDARQAGARVQTGQSVVAGALSSLSDVNVTGGFHVMDTVAYAKELDLQGVVQTDTIAKITSVTTPAEVIDVRWARLLAQHTGTYYEGEAEFDDENPPPEGLIFAEGDITVTTTGLKGKFTFASAAGIVTLQGSRVDATGYLSGVLVVAYTCHAKIGCHQSTLRGEISAPLGRIELHATDMTLHGICFGCEVYTSGGSMLLTDGTDPYMGPTK